MLYLCLDSSPSLKLSAFFNFNIVPFFMAWFLLYCGLAWRCIACLLLAVNRLLSKTYHDVRFKWLKYIRKGWKRESQYFRILQPNGCKIRKCWDSRFPVQIILIPLLNGLKIGKSWNRRSQLFPISQPF